MSIEATFRGYIESTQDTLLIFEACRRGHLPKICRRLQEKERKIVQSGSVFVFDERESGIKRWTDGLVWSPSRILGNFLIYRELDKRAPAGKKETVPVERQRSNSLDTESQAEKNKERALVGSLTNSYRFKKGGLIKKTMSIVVNGVAQHMISYYTKEDVLAGKLKTPSATPNLAMLEISSEFLVKQNFRIPPQIEPVYDQNEPQKLDYGKHPNGIPSRMSSIGSTNSPTRLSTHGMEYVHTPIKLETDNANAMVSDGYRQPPIAASAYTNSPPQSFAPLHSSFGYGANHSSNAGHETTSLPIPSVRPFPPHRQASYHEFPPVSPHINPPHRRPRMRSAPAIQQTTPQSLIPTITTSPMSGQSAPHHIGAANSDLSYYAHSANSWADHSFTPYHSSQGTSNQPSTSGLSSSNHMSTGGAHSETSGDVFYNTTTAHNETVYGSSTYSELPTTIPELYNPTHSSQSSISNSHSHSQQQQQQQHSTASSPTMRSTSSPPHTSNHAPITPPLTSANTNHTAIINAGSNNSGGFFAPTPSFGYTPYYASNFVKNDAYPSAMPANSLCVPYYAREGDF
ncbi:2477_t:CDS:2 [Paraglomus occultum]|uniref:2477_t:CDS:1 n=1 Tax=Paraglomus occultum TaxID=144539 RepID=A0A9N9BBU6_9GLOM|nr:2477_t:CDS:2 [Paraglomus occultum]